MSIEFTASHGFSVEAKGDFKDGYTGPFLVPVSLLVRNGKVTAVHLEANTYTLHGKKAGSDGYSVTLEPVSPYGKVSQ